MDKRTETSANNLGQYTKPKWKSGKTVAIRVPLVIKDELIEIAKELDNKGNDNSRNPVVNEAIEKLRDATTSKKDGGSYDGRRAKELRFEVLRVINLLENI